MTLNLLQVERIVRQALEEDIGTGDITTIATVPEEATTTGAIIVREEGVVAGLEVASLAFSLTDREIRFQPVVRDGDKIAAGQAIAQVAGRARPILMAERVALNFLQRMSGIATMAAKVAEALRCYNTKVVDTRKTTPGLRLLEKYAVRAGGCHNQRFGLYDAILIKDNHIVLAGGIKQAVMAARRYAPHTMRIEVEVENLEQLEEALEARADIIMLDNMDVETIRKAVKIANGRALLEASGGITMEKVVEVAKTGIDYISLGYLTHSARALDFSLEVGEVK